MNHDSWLICPPAAPVRRRPLEGSTFDRRCSLCDRRVVLSPYDAQILREHAELVIVCDSCAERDARTTTWIPLAEEGDA